MKTPHLMIVCGVPGAGKSTLARHACARWGAITFASETFAEQLGPTGRSASGDLTREAVAHAYDAMAKAAELSLGNRDLVLVAGSFRSQDQRERFRQLAIAQRSHATTLRVVCTAALAAERVRERRAIGERGPNEEAIRKIDEELNRAIDVDTFVTNEGSIGDFYQKIDAAMQSHGLRLARGKIAIIPPLA